MEPSVEPVRWLSSWRTWSLAVREAVLVAGMALAFGVAAFLAFRFNGVNEIAPVALAAVVCLVGAVLALAASHLLRGPSLGAVGILVSMAVRTGLPIVLLALIHLEGGLRNQPRLVYYFLFFYLLALVIETPLSLPSPDRSNQRSATSPHTH